MTPPSPRRGCFATPLRALPSSSRRYSNRPRRSSTSCPGVMHHPPLPPGPGLSLPIAVGALLRPPELLRPRLNRHLGQRVAPLAGEWRPPCSSQAPSRPGSQRSRILPWRSAAVSSPSVCSSPRAPSCCLHLHSSSATAAAFTPAAAWIKILIFLFIFLSFPCTYLEQCLRLGVTSTSSVCLPLQG